MSIMENSKYVYSVLFIISSSILYNTSGIEVKTTGTSQTSNLIQKSGKTDAFKHRRLHTPMVDKTNEYTALMKQHTHVDSMLELALPAHGSDVLVARNVDTIRKREVNDILNNGIDLTTTLEPAFVYEEEILSKSNGLNNQIDYTCHVTDHCTNRPFLARPCSVILSRADWGARDTRSVSYMNKTVSTIFIHHTAMARCFYSQECILEVGRIQNLHMDTKGWDDIGYSFLVGDDGMVYEARGWNRVGAHTRGWNFKSVSIAVMGNFNEVLPSDDALNAIDSLISCGIYNSNVLTNYTLYGHRAASKQFDSPGHMLNDLIQTWPHHANISASE